MSNAELRRYVSEPVGMVLQSLDTNPEWTMWPGTDAGQVQYYKKMLSGMESHVVTVTSPNLVEVSKFTFMYPDTTVCKMTTILKNSPIKPAWVLRELKSAIRYHPELPQIEEVTILSILHGLDHEEKEVGQFWTGIHVQVPQPRGCAWSFIPSEWSVEYTIPRNDVYMPVHRYGHCISIDHSGIMQVWVADLYTNEDGEPYANKGSRIYRVTQEFYDTEVAKMEHMLEFNGGSMPPQAGSHAVGMHVLHSALVSAGIDERTAIRMANKYK